MPRYWVLILLPTLLLAGCTAGVGIGGEFTEVVNERCVLLDGSAIALPRGMAARVDQAAIVEDPFIGGDTVVGRVGDQMTGGAVADPKTSGACGDQHDTYFQATGLSIEVPETTPVESFSN